MIKFTPRRRLIGGIRLPAHKEKSTAQPIRRGLIPARLCISMRQHRGPDAVPIVAVGQRVARGEPVAHAPARQGADVHSPTSGTVVAIEERLSPLFSSVASSTCVVIETDGEHRAFREAAPVAQGRTRDAVLDQIAGAGIVGLGGAVFPTAAKLDLDPAVPCRMLIVNGAECEPYISCDDMLMREAPEEIVRGAAILRQITGAAECVIAIERDKPQAIDAITRAAERLDVEGLRIAELPSIYPAGGERQLVEVLTGTEVPSSRYPGDYGFICQNVGTAQAVHNFYERGEPLTSRVVTVTGSAVAEPRNIEAMIGTPIADLIEACGGYTDHPVRLIHGGSMMGYALESDALAITKATNCIVVAAADDVRKDEREWPCIRCGECAIVCPARLQPQDLLLAARSENAAALQALALTECIECGCCDVVCPSHIPLTETFRGARHLIRARNQRQEFSNAAENRFRAREQRRDEIRRAEEGRREELRQVLQQDDSRADAIRAAVDRSQRRKLDKVDDGG